MSVGNAFEEKASFSTTDGGDVHASDMAEHATAPYLDTKLKSRHRPAAVCSNLLLRQAKQAVISLLWPRRHMTSGLSLICLLLLI